MIAKCVTWGYAPWTTRASTHQACTRLAGADYSGDGEPWTLDGTIVDAYDNLGIQDPVPDPDMHFEAAFGADGAVCASRTRHDVRDRDGDVLVPSCFDTLPECASLEDANAAEAVLAVRSEHQVIAACD